LRGVSIAKHLVKIYLADNQVNDALEVLDAFKSCMIKNKNLGRYDIKHNNFGNEGIQFFTDMLGELANHVYEIEISERIDK